MKINYTLIIFIILILTSCCNKSDENYGIIQNNLDIDGYYISTYDCLNLPDTACIRNSDQYNEVFSVTGTDSDCKNIKIPDVDFSEYSILINHKEESGKIFFQRTVSVDSLNKIITYLITTEGCPVITDYRTDSYNIVLVPKIGEDYSVEYK